MMTTVVGNPQLASARAESNHPADMSPFCLLVWSTKCSAWRPPAGVVKAASCDGVHVETIMLVGCQPRGKEEHPKLDPQTQGLVDPVPSLGRHHSFCLQSHAQVHQVRHPQEQMPARPLPQRCGEAEQVKTLPKTTSEETRGCRAAALENCRYKLFAQSTQKNRLHSVNSVLQVTQGGKSCGDLRQAASASVRIPSTKVFQRSSAPRAQSGCPPKADRG